MVQISAMLKEPVFNVTVGRKSPFRRFDAIAVRARRDRMSFIARFPICPLLLMSLVILRTDMRHMIRLLPRHKESLLILLFQ